MEELHYLDPDTKAAVCGADYDGIAVAVRIADVSCPECLSSEEYWEEIGEFEEYPLDQIRKILGGNDLW